ncbi:hypothetical protein BTVI_115255 [Pitangus sulphuratus]|nr:hypothetical protein BTVI_115255 [Pitangus sulphuratus]
MPTSSKTDPPLAKPKPFSGGVSASVTVYLRWGKMLQSSSWREELEYVKEIAPQTPSWPCLWTVTKGVSERQHPVNGSGRTLISLLGDEGIKNSPIEKDLGMLVDERLDMSWKCGLEAQKASCILACIKSRVVSRAMKGILHLYSSLVKPHPEYCIQLWCPQHRKGMDLLE